MFAMLMLLLKCVHIKCVWCDAAHASAQSTHHHSHIEDNGGGNGSSSSTRHSNRNLFLLDSFQCKMRARARWFYAIPNSELVIYWLRHLGLESIEPLIYLYGWLIVSIFHPFQFNKHVEKGALYESACDRIVFMRFTRIYNVEMLLFEQRWRRRCRLWP